MKKQHPSKAKTRKRIEEQIVKTVFATRSELGLTQAEFAKRTGYSKSAIEKHERDERAGKTIRPRILNILLK